MASKRAAPRRKRAASKRVPRPAAAPIAAREEQPAGETHMPGWARRAASAAQSDEERVQTLRPGKRRIVPVLPVRHTVLFPFAILPMNVGRPSSVQLLNHCMSGDRMLAVIAQKDPSNETPGALKEAAVSQGSQIGRRGRTSARTRAGAKG